MKSFIITSIGLAFLSSAVAARTFTVRNNCDFVIWPAMFTDPKVNTPASTPNHKTGWRAEPHSAETFPVPDNWKAGRIWGRRGCDFSTNPGPNSCLTGGCNGGLECDKQTGTGVPPTTVAEWTLANPGDGHQDNYDVSLVDGFDLPMRITNNKDCDVAGCAASLNANCPDKLKGPKTANGVVVGCNSACSANLDGNPSDSANCCSGSHDKPETCPASGVQFYHYFKDACPTAYAYAYDDKTGLHTCNSNLGADYTLTFCP